jgi:pimeloyl-ACP methyl ester carboxylesterase
MDGPPIGHVELLVLGQPGTEGGQVDRGDHLDGLTGRQGDPRSRRGDGVRWAEHGGAVRALGDDAGTDGHRAAAGRLDPDGAGLVDVEQSEFEPVHPVKIARGRGFQPSWQDRRVPYYSADDGLRLYYEVTGDGPPLVVLPGGPGMDVRYLGDLGGLSATRRLILADARAGGRSEVPEDRSTVSFVTQAADLEALREHLGLDRLDVLAHSAGTLTAQEYAVRRPTRVRRLILVTPIGRAGRDIDRAEVAAIRAGRAGEPWYPQAATATGPFAQARMVPFHWHRWTPRRRLEYVPGHASALPWFRDAFYAGTATPGPVLAPTLVLAGASDGMIGTAPARVVAAAHPYAHLEVMSESGHRPWVEQPELFSKLVEDFLRA